MSQTTNQVSIPAEIAECFDLLRKTSTALRNYDERVSRTEFRHCVQREIGGVEEALASVAINLSAIAREEITQSLYFAHTEALYNKPI
ncbi:MAG: hypothetical protein SNG38_08370 [Rikenellaceae bacterium]